MKHFAEGALFTLIVYSALMLVLVSHDVKDIQRTVHKSAEQIKRFESNREEQESSSRIDFYKQEIECLAKNMYFEARGEGESGQNAVAFVTINRVESDRYPDTICEVVYQAKRDSRGNPIRNRCQFSWYCDGKVDSVRESVYNRLYRRAEYIYINYYLNDMMNDTTEGSTHYHAKYVEPFWSKHENYQYVASIGQHVFYQPTY